MSNNPRYWSDDEIRDYFDSNPNLRMSQLARMTGKSMPELKRILMPGRRAAITKEGQAIREALGFPKEAGESFYATDNAVELAAKIAREINKRGGRARVVKGPYGPEKNLVMAAVIEVPSMGGTFKDVRIEVTEGEWSQQPSINARFGPGRGHGLPLGDMNAGPLRLGWGDAKKVVDGMEEGVAWILSHRRAALGFPKD